MKSTDTERLHTRIDRKLTRVAKSLPVPPIWHGAWSALGPQSTEEERLRVCQAIREAGTLTEYAGYFLVCWAAEKLADDELARLADPLRLLNVFESERAFDRILRDLLKEHSEGRMAALFRTDPEEHVRRRVAGRLFFFGPIEEEEAEDPDWLDRLLRSVAARVVASRPVESLAYRYRPSQFIRELHVCPRAHAADPARPNWAVDIESLRESFDEIDGCGWYAAPADPGESPYFWMEGTFDSRQVFLRLLPDAADAAEQGKDLRGWKKP